MSRNSNNNIGADVLAAAESVGLSIDVCDDLPTCSDEPIQDEAHVATEQRGDAEEHVGGDDVDVAASVELANGAVTETENEEHKRVFYEKYKPVYEQTKKKGLNLITDAEYETIEGILRDWKSWDTRVNGERPKHHYKYRKNYIYKPSLPGNTLWRGGKKVATYESLFSIIDTAHKTISHSRDARTNKRKVDETYNRVSETPVQIYIKTCPECVAAFSRPSQSKMGKLQMIFSNTVGTRMQIDLIDFTSHEYKGYKWILRAHDHLSQYQLVRALKNKTAEETGKALLQILAGSLPPEILQSDNGKEFLGYCIRMLNTLFPGIHVVRGRPRHPQSQGGVERTNKTFKEAVRKWMNRNKDDPNWPEVGIYVVAAGMNERSSRNTADHHPNRLMFGQRERCPAIRDFGPIIKAAETEWGVLAAKHVQDKGVPTVESITAAIRAGDELYREYEGVAVTNCERLAHYGITIPDDDAVSI